MTSLNTEYAGLNLKNPIIVGSSGLTNNAKKNKELEKSGAGAIVLKSLFEEQIEMMSDYMLEGTDYPEASDYIRNYVKSDQLVDYLGLVRETKKLCSIPVIVSINCYKANAWTDFAKQIESAGADAIELNIFSISTDIHNHPEGLVKDYIQILRKVKSVVRIPVIVKMTKMFGNIPYMVNKLYENGAAAVVMFNKYYQPDIDVHSLQIVSGHVFSSAVDISDTLRWTGIVSGIIPQINIACSTGIHDWEDVLKCILAGASAVQIASVIYQHGNEVIPQMLRSIEEWMATMNYKTITDFKGKLNFSNIPDPQLYERAQFMKYFSNRD